MGANFHGTGTASFLPSPSLASRSSRVCCCCCQTIQTSSNAEPSAWQSVSFSCSHSLQRLQSQQREYASRHPKTSLARPLRLSTLLFLCSLTRFASPVDIMNQTGKQSTLTHSTHTHSHRLRERERETRHILVCLSFADFSFLPVAAAALLADHHRQLIISSSS